MSSNPHQPITEDRTIRCAAEDCSYAMHRITARPEQEQTRIDDYLLELFRSTHADQYSPGRAPDIAVDWTISALCSVCPDGIGDVELNDGESVTCRECLTTWSMDGTHGELEEIVPTAPEDDAQDVIGESLAGQPAGWAPEDCTHPSLTGDEGPIAELGRYPVRWKCDTCGAIVHQDTTAAGS